MRTTRDLREIRPCPWCGETLPAVFNFCIYCGKSISDDKTPPEPDGLDVPTDELEGDYAPVDADAQSVPVELPAAEGPVIGLDSGMWSTGLDDFLDEASSEEDDEADAQTTLFEDDADSATTILDAGPSITLRRLSTGELYDVTTPCVLGKGTRASVQITGNSAISRQHAKIDQLGHDLTVEDLGSTNGTELNGRTLAVGERCAVSDGDTIRLADELFAISVS